MPLATCKPTLIVPRNVIDSPPYNQISESIRAQNLSLSLTHPGPHTTSPCNKLLRHNPDELLTLVHQFFLPLAVQQVDLQLTPTPQIDGTVPHVPAPHALE